MAACPRDSTAWRKRDDGHAGGAIPGRVQRNYILLLLGLVFVIDAVAVDRSRRRSTQGRTPAASAPFPVCFINGNLELPAPHVVWPED